MANVTIEEKLLDKQNSRNIIRAKLVELGLAESSAKLDALANIISNIVNRGAVSVQLKEGETYTIEQGYHDGSGTVSGVAGGGDYKLEPTKTVTPTKRQQNVTPSSGFYGLEGVTVNAIPEIYQDVSSVNAEAADVLATKVFVDKTGTIVAGTMTNNGAVTQILDATVITYTIAQGYHSGTGTVSITLENKTVTPTKAQQKVTASPGKVLGEVTVEPIPDNYIDPSGATAAAAKVLAGETFYAGDSVEKTGTMPNNGAVSKTLDTTTPSHTIAQGYHSGAGSVNVVLEEKSATPTKSAQDIVPTSGKVLSKVSVEAIPDAYQNVTNVDAVASDVLSGKTIVTSDGTEVAGTMPNNGATSGSIDGITTTSVSVPAGYTTGGSVTFDDSAIIEMLEAI